MPTSHIMDFIGNNFPSLVYLWKIRKGRFRRAAPMAETFTQIYHHNRWGDAESRSGAASNLSNTRAVRKELPRLVEDLGIRSMLDSPCGDFNWMKEVPLDLDRYIGADIVQPLTESNRKFEDDIRAFVTLDITSDALPAVDLILCRDCLIHFSFSDIFRAIEQIKASRSRYLLTTTFTSRKRRNIDIVTGDWRVINLQRPPFNFPPPISIIREGLAADGDRYSDRSLALWRIVDL